MKLKSAISLLFIACLSTFFSACSSAASKDQSEVVIDKSSTRSTEEVYITNADVKKENSDDSSGSTLQLPGGSSVNTTLGDNSKVESLTDAFGNKAETRYFEGHPRLRMLIVRTSVEGGREVTVYGNGGDTMLVNGLGDRALTASADEIANAAGLTSTVSSGPAKNFMKRQPSQSSQLQPLPSSAFQKPAAPVYQSNEAASTETTPPPAKPEEDED